jgi:hypothetical protein
LREQRDEFVFYSPVVGANLKGGEKRMAEFKKNIKPLCDEHLDEQMDPVGIRLGESDPLLSGVEDAFRCPRKGCSRIFDSGGYRSLHNGSIKSNRESHNFIGCEDGAMFIESVEEDRLIWRCSKNGCEQSRTTDRVSQASVAERAEVREGKQRFLRLVGAITGLPRDLSSRKGFSRR